MPMTPTLGTPLIRLAAGLAGAALVTLTAGCGGSSSTATDPDAHPASDPAGSPSASPGRIRGATVLPLISATAAGGRGGTVATALDSAADVARFTAQFRGPGLAAQVQAAVAGRLRAGDQDVVAQVVAIGCDRPPGVDVMRNPDGSVSLVPHEVASPLQECLAPVTTVAIAVLPTT